MDEQTIRNSGGEGQPALILDKFVARGKKSNPNICFPRELREDLKKWPFVRFSLISNDRTSVNLPVPPGLTFSDSMQYSTMNLGLIGSIMNDTISSVSNSASGKSLLDLKTWASGAGGGIGALAGSLKNRASHLNAAAAMSIGARNLLHMDSVADAIDYGNKQIISPNTNTTFQGTGVRSFGFTFKMAPKDKGDTDSIKEIVSIFRSKMYPEGNNVLMKYPDKWRITFYNGEGKVNSYIPKIFETYLTAFSSTYNGSSNMYHKDGSPVEVDIAIGFQETKALTREQIDKLL